MNSNMSIGGMGSPSQFPLERKAEVNVSREKEPTPSTTVAQDLQIQSLKDMKEAERKGTQVTIAEEQVIKAIEKANKALSGVTTSLEFSIHKKTKEVMVKVLDKETGQIIREIPPEKTLDMLAGMWELAGLLVDKKA